jgi:hypothetical protein
MLARLPRTLRPLSRLVGVGLFAVAGCSSSAADTVAVTHPTMIEVAPASFSGDVACSPDGRGLKRYVATLFDINYVSPDSSGGTGGSSANEAGGSSAGGEFQLPSSSPVSCRAPVGFGYVVAGRRYRFEVDGFDTEDVRPRALGSREMSDSQNKLVTPKWQAKCGGSPDPDSTVIAVDSTIVQSSDCGQPFAADVAATSSLTIKLSSLLGELRCGGRPGEVDHFEVSLARTGAEPEVQSVPCAADARATFDELAAGETLSASVTAFSADAESAFAGASCSARTLPAANVDATCTALNQTGTLRVDLPAALSLLELSCDARSLTRLEIRVPGDDAPQIITPPACLQPFDRGFGPGAAALTVTAMSGTTAPLTELGSVTCHAEVTPGALVSASCTLNTAN